MAKYKIDFNDSIEHNGKTLYRVIATRNFKTAPVKRGDKGGYIEGVANLSETGDCWVYDNAIVCDMGRVIGNARILNNAIVDSFATVADGFIMDNAHITENAYINSGNEIKIQDNAVVKGNTKIIGMNIFIKGNVIVDELLISNDSFHWLHITENGKEKIKI